MSVSPNIRITSGNEAKAEDIKKMVERAVRDMMGDIREEMTKKLSRQFANMGIA